ncbi:hypothetical protein CAPTEDRAFT_201827, partial [Capitella teleta]
VETAFYVGFKQDQAIYYYKKNFSHMDNQKRERRTSESSSKGNLSEGNDVIQGEENAESAHIYEEISDAANSGGDSHEYENANAAKNTRDEPHSVTMANDDQINSHNTKARDQQDETPYLILLDSEQQSDQ